MTKPAKVVLGVFALIVLLAIVGKNRDKFNTNLSTVAAPPSGGFGNIQIAKRAPTMERYDLGQEAAQYEPGDESGGGDEYTSAESTTRLIIRTGELSLVVTDVPGSVQKISDYAVNKGGFVVSSGITKTDIAPYGTVVVRIPVAAFDASVNEIKSFGQLESQSMNGTDVTEQYVDDAARLKNLQATEQQFLAIMRQAVKITDILEVQRQLTQVRGEIESLQGRIKYLQQSAALSTLTVHLSTDPNALPVVRDDANVWKPIAVLKDAARTLKYAFERVASYIIWFVVFIPLWIAIIVGLWIAVKVVTYVWKRFIQWGEKKS